MFRPIPWHSSTSLRVFYYLFTAKILIQFISLSPQISCWRYLLHFICWNELIFISPLSPPPALFLYVYFIAASSETCEYLLTLLCYHFWGWGCRICQLHFCSGLRLTSKKATYWLWVVTHNVWRWDPGGWTVCDRATKLVTWPATLYFGPYWTIGAVRDRPDPIKWLSCRALASIWLSWPYSSNCSWQTST